VIAEIDDNKVIKSSDLLVYLERNKRAGDWITLMLIRNGEEIQIQLELGARKAP
jgi:S1-C subfamily serine protease